MGVLIISDDIPELMEMCSRILVMKNGRIHDEYGTRETSESQLNEALVST